MCMISGKFKLISLNDNTPVYANHHQHEGREDVAPGPHHHQHLAHEVARMPLQHHNLCVWTWIMNDEWWMPTCNVSFHSVSMGMVMKQVMQSARVRWNTRKWTLVLDLMSGLKDCLPAMMRARLFSTMPTGQKNVLLKVVFFLFPITNFISNWTYYRLIPPPPPNLAKSLV